MNLHKSTEIIPKNRSNDTNNVKSFIPVNEPFQYSTDNLSSYKMSLPQGIICLDYNISQDNPNKIYFKRDFEAFTKNPMISTNKANSFEGSVQLSISEKKNYTYNDLMNNQIGKKRNSDNKFITLLTELNEKKPSASINGDEESSNYKNPSQIEDKEEGIERVIAEFSFSLNHSGLSHTEKKIQEKNRSVLVKRLLGYYKTIMNEEDKSEEFLSKMEEYTKEKAEDLKVRY